MITPCFGSDFDNTIIEYTHLFRPSAESFDIEVPPSCFSKEEVRNYIRSLKDGEILWQKIQADVYGIRIKDAILIDGFGQFVTSCRDRHIPLYIVSQKSRNAAQKPEVNLQEVALQWMAQQGFFDSDKFGFDRNHIFFEPTRAQKIHRIQQTGCTLFVDDMIEVFTDLEFPESVTRILLSDTNIGDLPNGVLEAISWSQITHDLFNGGTLD
jgi:hypothetical protein